MKFVTSKNLLFEISAQGLLCRDVERNTTFLISQAHFDVLKRAAKPTRPLDSPVWKDLLTSRLIEPFERGSAKENLDLVTRAFHRGAVHDPTLKLRRRPSARTRTKLLKLPRLEQNETSLQSVLRTRRSRRIFSSTPLSQNTLGNVLANAAQAVDQVTSVSIAATTPKGHRDGAVTPGTRLYPYPVAGAMNSLDVFVLATAVKGLRPALYRYRASSHRLQLVNPAEPRLFIAEVFDERRWLRKAGAVLVITGDLMRRQSRYTHALKMLLQESGCLMQNLLLAAEAEALAACPFGFVQEDAFAAFVQQGRSYRKTKFSPLVAIAIGNKKGERK